MKITDEDHSFLMEQARQRTAFDYKDYVEYESDNDDESVGSDGELDDLEGYGDELSDIEED